MAGDGEHADGDHPMEMEEVTVVDKIAEHEETAGKEMRALFDLVVHMGEDTSAVVAKNTQLKEEVAALKERIAAGKAALGDLDVDARAAVRDDLVAAVSKAEEDIAARNATLEEEVEPAAEKIAALTLLDADRVDTAVKEVVTGLVSQGRAAADIDDLVDAIEWWAQDNYKPEIFPDGRGGKNRGGKGAPRSAKPAESAADVPQALRLLRAAYAAQRSWNRGSHLNYFLEEFKRHTGADQPQGDDDGRRSRTPVRSRSRSYTPHRSRTPSNHGDTRMSRSRTPVRRVSRSVSRPRSEERHEPAPLSRSPSRSRSPVASPDSRKRRRSSSGSRGDSPPRKSRKKDRKEKEKKSKKDKKSRKKKDKKDKKKRKKRSYSSSSSS